MLKYFFSQNTRRSKLQYFNRHDTNTLGLTRLLLTSSGRFRKIQPDSGWMSKYLRSSRWKGAAKLYLMAPLLSASSSEAETLSMLVPMFVSCLTFSMYF